MDAAPFSESQTEAGASLAPEIFAPEDVPADIAGLLIAEDGIKEAHRLWPSQLPPGKSVAHYAAIYGGNFLDPRVDRFSSVQRMGFNKLSQEGAPVAGTPEYAELLREHELTDPMPSKHCLMDYLESYRKHGETGKLYLRLDELQREWVRRFLALRRAYAEARRREASEHAMHLIETDAA